jgi:hypothetical protein
MPLNICVDRFSNVLEKVEAGGSSKKGTGVGFGEMAAET